MGSLPPQTQILPFLGFLLQFFSHWLRTMDFQMVFLTMEPQNASFSSTLQNLIDSFYNTIFHGSCFCFLNSVFSENPNDPFSYQNLLPFADKDPADNWGSWDNLGSCDNWHNRNILDDGKEFDEAVLLPCNSFSISWASLLYQWRTHLSCSFLLNASWICFWQQDKHEKLRPCS